MFKAGCVCSPPFFLFATSLDYAHSKVPPAWDPCDDPFYSIGETGQTPIADAAGPGLPAGPVGVFDLCFGQVNTPPPTGAWRELCTIQFVPCVDADVTITASALRGEVAGGSEGTVWTVNVPAVPVSVSFICECWDRPCHPSGDANGDCAIDTIDLYILVNAATASFSGEACADFNRDGATDTIDLYIMVNAATASFNTCPADCTPIR